MSAEVELSKSQQLCVSGADRGRRSKRVMQYRFDDIYLYVFGDYNILSYDSNKTRSLAYV